MRATIRLDEELLREAKKVAAESGRTLTALIEDSLRETLARRRAAPTRQRITLTTFKGRGLRPGIDLNNSALLLDIMEGIVGAPGR